VGSPTEGKKKKSKKGRKFKLDQVIKIKIIFVELNKKSLDIIHVHLCL
jgi:hypothetical protein